jgi:AAA15 family ATPase/GTPase
MMGEGVRRLLGIVMAIAGASGGRVLIDEIENGLHYSVMVDVWQAIAHAARQANVQVFATTHSFECIAAAHEAFSQGPSYDFALHRLEEGVDGIEAVTYDQETMATALELEHEVR